MTTSTPSHNPIAQFTEAYWDQSRQPLASLVFIAPILVVYEAGVLVFGVINYGLTFIGVNPFWQQIIKGTIIISAVAFALYSKRKHGLVRV